MTEPRSSLAAALSDRYAIERELGRGGMATVYLALDKKHGRNVAIKVLRPGLAASLGAERFLREIGIAARLAHPHIVPLIDSGEAAGQLYYVQPHVPGGSLRERLDREKRLAVKEALRIAQEVGGGLDYAHRNGLVHRDVKPENILFAEGHALLVDFGVARACCTLGAELVTDAGIAVGTPEYMSPEQASGEQTLGTQSDVYSLGCVVYEMLAGEPPLCGAGPRATMAKQVTEGAPARACAPSRSADRRGAGAGSGAREGSGGPVRDGRRVRRSTGKRSLGRRPCRRRLGDRSLDRRAAVRQRQSRRRERVPERRDHGRADRRTA
jgi:serine/threonine-protein kinase